MYAVSLGKINIYLGVVAAGCLFVEFWFLGWGMKESPLWGDCCWLGLVLLELLALPMPPFPCFKPPETENHWFCLIVPWNIAVCFKTWKDIIFNRQSSSASIDEIADIIVVVNTLKKRRWRITFTIDEEPSATLNPNNDKIFDIRENIRAKCTRNI